ncbi:MAG: hypothetical protein RL701_4146 [Pseudomonadota bacterium]
MSRFAQVAPIAPAVVSHPDGRCQRQPSRYGLGTPGFPRMLSRRRRQAASAAPEW